MKLQKLFIFFIIFFIKASCMDPVSTNVDKPLKPDNSLLITLPTELLPVIGSYFNCSTMGNWKRTCKDFNKFVNYENISPCIIKFENYDKCTNGLMYFADNNQQKNFTHLMQNNFDQRIADIRILCGEKNPSLQNQINVYKEVYSKPLDYEKFDRRTLLRLIHINPNMQNAQGKPILLSTYEKLRYRKNQTELIELLLKNKRTNPNILDENDFPLLSNACDDNEIEIVTWLLSHKKTNINIQNTYGHTALHYALYEDRINIIKLLLSNKKIKVNTPDTYGHTILHSACSCNKIEIVKLLLENKETDPNIQSKFGFTALSGACDDGHTTIVQLLLDNGANPNIPDNNSYTALDHACNRGYTEIATLLLAKNAFHSWKYFLFRWQYYMPDLKPYEHYILPITALIVILSFLNQKLKS